MVIKDFALEGEALGNWMIILSGAVRHDPQQGVRKARIWFHRVGAGYTFLGNPIAREVEVGVLPQIDVGAIWSNQNRLVESHPKSDTWKKIVVDIAPNTLPESLILFDGKKMHGCRGYPFPYGENIRALFIRQDGVTVIIPCTAVAHYLFFASSKMVHTIFKNNYRKHYTILEATESQEPNVLELGKGFTKHLEVNQLARLAFCGLARGSADYIHRSIQAMTSQPGSSEPSWVNYSTKFPFRHPQKVELFGKHFQWRGEKFFLAARVVGCDLPWPYKNLRIAHDEDNSKGETILNEDVQQYHNVKYAITTGTEDIIATHDAPSGLSGTKEIKVSRESLSSALEPSLPTVTKQKKEEQDAAYEGHTTYMGRVADGASTYDQIGGNTNLDHAEFFQEQPVSPKNDDYIPKFRRILEGLLVLANPDGKIDYLSFEGYGLMEGYYTILPYRKFQDAATRNPGMAALLYYPKRVYADGRTDNPGEASLARKGVRRMVVAHFFFAGKHFYLVEIDPTGYPLNTVMLYLPNMMAIPEGKLLDVIDENVREQGRWKKMENFLTKKMGILSVRFDHEADGEAKKKRVAKLSEELETETDMLKREELERRLKSAMMPSKGDDEISVKIFQTIRRLSGEVHNRQ